MKILISGGTGLIGTAVVSKLRERGHSVNVLVREKTTYLVNFTGVFLKVKLKLLL